MHMTQRLYLERSLATDCSLASQSEQDHLDWTNSGFTFRVLCHYDKLFVIWKHADSGPEVLGRIRVINLDACTRDGLGVCLDTNITSKDDGAHWVSHNPSRLFGLPVFAHVPFISEVSYTPEGRTPEKFVTRFPLVFKTCSNPNDPVIGDTYVTQLGEFRNTYPEFEDLKL